MSERFSDSEPRHPVLNRIVIIDALQEIGVDVELYDWINYSDPEILSDLARYSAILNIGMEDLFEVCGIEIEVIGGDNEV